MNLQKHELSDLDQPIGGYKRTLVQVPWCRKAARQWNSMKPSSGQPNKMCMPCHHEIVAITEISIPKFTVTIHIGTKNN